jgi:5-oxoprolinase (ATP-hydrolysing)
MLHVSAKVHCAVIFVGLVQEEGVTELLQAPAKSGVPGVVGTRCLSDNLSDLRAQVAANSKGIALVGSLIAEYTLPVVQAYMAHIQAHAEEAVRQMLCEFSTERVCLPLREPSGLPSIHLQTGQPQLCPGYRAH